MDSAAPAALSVCYALVMLLSAVRIVRLVRVSLGAGAVVHRRSLAVLLGLPLIFVALQLTAIPTLDRNLLLGTFAALAGAVAFGTRGRPLDFMDADARDGLFEGLAPEHRASSRKITRTQLRVIALTTLGAAAAAIVTFLVGPTAP